MLNKSKRALTEVGREREREKERDRIRKTPTTKTKMTKKDIGRHRKKNRQKY